MSLGISGDAERPRCGLLNWRGAKLGWAFSRRSRWGGGIPRRRGIELVGLATSGFLLACLAKESGQRELVGVVGFVSFIGGVLKKNRLAKP